ncbi:GNAT family N-acetyltransferase [Paenibacillus marchantiae]|uniref:GNAT family N-acetyltransferase n=1 Tax=Paenibacillus marchantiae TaxID=3026433 RepID=UPI00237A5E57|nr:GNAT family N-acetyltransferase [Paenibacillus marchantiae]WDQ32470.1 GNAT family N-acetyltransferase [Paenibacillus marchantiae]
MIVDLTPVTLAEKNMLSNLYQLYHYDFSEFTSEDINQEGKYDVNIDFIWEGDNRWRPYFITISGTIAGFVIVLLENLDTDPDPTHVIYDFMILKKFRRSGVGYAAAMQIFELYKANWALAQMESNTPAIAFWRKVLKDYTNDHYTETFRDDARKYIQTFSTKE